MQEQPESTSGIDSQDALTPVDLERYPIHRPGDPLLQGVIQQVRENLEDEGCARLAGFVRPELRAALRRETAELAPQAVVSNDPYTPYGTAADESFPEGHPRRQEFRSTSGNVGKDQVPEHSLTMRLYHSDSFRGFLAACLSADEIYEFADPIRGLTVNVMREGTSLGWHFDANEFVVTLMTCRATSGGLFEYCPGIREPGNENYAAVQSVLEGARERVKVLDLQIGDLQLFKGRFSMHRVTQVTGERHTVIFGYSRKPGFIGRVASTMRVYGRVMQEHIDAEAERHEDGLTD